MLKISANARDFFYSQLIIKKTLRHVIEQIYENFFHIQSLHVLGEGLKMFLLSCMVFCSDGQIKPLVSSVIFQF